MRPSPIIRRVLAGAALGFGAAVVVAVVVPPSTFTTRAIIGVGASEQAMRLAMAQAARDAIRSKPVMTRAAASLIAARVAPPDPAFSERAAVLVGVGGVHATGREARLAELLLSKVTTAVGESAATVDVIASDAQADVAAQIAGAVADAFLADHEERALESRRQRDIATAARTEELIKAASAAHARLLALGGSMVDPAQAHAVAAAQTAQAQARVDAIRAIIASATPPLSDRKDIPDSVAAMQRTYLDLSAKLATARETLGDRHTTIISLRDGVAQAAANLNAEWKRLLRIAQGEADLARAREAAQRKPDAPSDATRRAALEEARAAAQRADDAIARAEAPRPEPADDRVYRLYAAAPVPSLPSGFSDLGRAALAAFAAILAFVAALSAPRLGRSKPAPVTKPVTEPVAAKAGRAEAAPKPETRSSYFDLDIEDEIAPSIRAADHEAGHDTDIPASRAPRPIRIATPREADTGLREALTTILDRLESTEISGEVATIVVAATDAETATAPVALSLARAASATGRRVLVLEWAGSRTAMAAYAHPDSEPMLIDVFGTLRVALEPASDEDCLMLAPALRNGQRIAASLAREGATPFVDDLAAAFDLIVVDGGRAGSDRPAADACLRVGRYTSRRDDERFLAMLGAAREAFAGTMIGRVFVPPSQPFPARRPSRVVVEDAPPEPAVSLSPRVVAERAPMPRRKVAMR